MQPRAASERLSLTGLQPYVLRTTVPLLSIILMSRTSKAGCKPALVPGAVTSARRRSPTGLKHPAISLVLYV